MKSLTPVIVLLASAAFVLGAVSTGYLLNRQAGRPYSPERIPMTVSRCLHTGGRIHVDSCAYPIESWYPFR